MFLLGWGEASAVKNTSGCELYSKLTMTRSGPAAKVDFIKVGFVSSGLNLSQRSRYPAEKIGETCVCICYGNMATLKKEKEKSLI